MSGTFRPNILRRKKINTNLDTANGQSNVNNTSTINVKEKSDQVHVDPQNALEKSRFYQKLVNILYSEKFDCQEEARVKRKRENSPTLQKHNIDHDNVAGVDREARLAIKKPSILRRPQPQSKRKNALLKKPLFSEVEFLDENVWNIGSESEDPVQPSIEETNYPRTVHDKFEWKIIKEINSNQTRREPFIGKPGPVTNFTSPCEAFTAIWNPDVLHEIIQTSNKNGEAINNAKIEQDKINNRMYLEPPWKDITISEMYVYLAIVLSTVACKKFTYHANFPTSDDINYTPLYSKYMQHSRFRKINMALSFIDKSMSQDTESDNYQDKILSIKPLVDLLNGSFSSLYSLHQNIVIEKIKSAHTPLFRKFERVIGLFDSSTGYCWQLSIILDEVPKYTSLLKRYVETQCRNEDIDPNERNIPEKDPPVYVKSQIKRKKKNKLSEKDFKTTDNQTKTSNDTPEVTTNESLNDRDIPTDGLPKTYSNKKGVGNDLEKSKKHSTKKLNETDPINTDNLPKTNVSTTSLDKPEKSTVSEKPTNLQGRRQISSKSREDAGDRPQTIDHIGGLPGKPMFSSGIPQAEIMISGKPQDDILYDEDLPPLTRPIPATVLSLVENLHFKGHCLFMDWSFQSLPLARTLKSLGIDCVGSFRDYSQYAPEELKLYIDGKRELIPGQVLGFTTNDIDIILWNERRMFALISTYHGLATVGETNLLAAVDYNFGMSVLDRFRKTMKKLYVRPIGNKNLQGRLYVPCLLEISVMNAYILYQSSMGSNKMNLAEFVNDLVEGLLDQHSAYGVGSKGIVVNVSSDLRDHLPIPCKGNTRECAFCVEETVVYTCVGCNKYLCFGCFGKYHETIATALEISSEKS